jgi:hypothetical protein
VRDDGSVSPSEAAGLKLLRYDENTIKTVSFTDTAPVYSPAVHLQLTSDRMGQSVQRWLAIAPANYSQISVGPAQLEIGLAENDQQLQEFLSPPLRQRELLLSSGWRSPLTRPCTMLRMPVRVFRQVYLLPIHW